MCTSIGRPYRLSAHFLSYFLYASSANRTTFLSPLNKPVFRLLPLFYFLSPYLVFPKHAYGFHILSHIEIVLRIFILVIYLLCLGQPRRASTVDLNAFGGHPLMDITAYADVRFDARWHVRISTEYSYFYPFFPF